ALVPHRGEGAPRAQDAHELGHGGRGLEPVERLETGDEIDGRIRQPRVLGGAVDPAERVMLDPGGAHRGVRLDGDDLEPAFEEGQTRDPGAGADVGHPLRREREERLDGGVGIAGAMATIALGAAREPVGGAELPEGHGVHHGTPFVANGYDGACFPACGSPFRRSWSPPSPCSRVPAAAPIRSSTRGKASAATAPARRARAAPPAPPTAASARDAATAAATARRPAATASRIAGCARA